ncbi:MAG: PP0621 family protein [Thiogranum sp.]
MIGLRTLVFIVGIALVVWILRRLSKGRSVASRPGKQVSNMVRCAHCGTYIPFDEALQAHGKYYCSKAHRDEDR